MNRAGEWASRAHPPSLQCPWQSKPETCTVSTSSRRDRLEGDPQIINAAGHGWREQVLRGVRWLRPGPGAVHNGPWDAKYDPDVYTHIQDLSRQWTLLPGGWFHGLTRSPVALAYGPPLPRLARGPWFVSNVAVGRLTMAQWDPLGSIFPEAWAGGRVQVHHQDGQGRGALRVGMGIDRHGAARCVRQPLFFLLLLPRVAAKGQGGQHAVGVMRRVLMAFSSSPLFLLLLCHDDELRVQAQMRAPPLDRMLPVVP